MRAGARLHQIQSRIDEQITYQASDLIFTALISVLIISQVHSQQSTNKKNVILITVDDMNDWANPFGGYNKNLSITPNIKKLAAKGTLVSTYKCNSLAVDKKPHSYILP